MEQTSAFAVYNKSKLLKEKNKGPHNIKLKKIHAKKKHILENNNVKNLNYTTSQKKLKNKLKKNKIPLLSTTLIASNTTNKNAKNLKIRNIPHLLAPRIESSVTTKKATFNSGQKKMKKLVKEQQTKVSILRIPTVSSIDIDSDGEEIPTLVKIPHNQSIKSNISLKKKQIRITEDSTENGKQLFQWMIHPTSVADFFENNWEKVPLYVKRNDNKYFGEMFSSEALDSMLRNNLLYFNTNVDIAIYENGERKDADTVGRALPNLVWDSYSMGYTVRIKDPQTYNFKLRNILSTLQEFFGCFVSANVYLTPPDSQGFAPHYDDIEAFIIQVEGRKHWKLYNPPKDEDVLARYSSPNYARDVLSERPLKEITLNAGDVLYFPRGTVHEGHTDADSHSLHITVSTYQTTAYADLLQYACTQALQKAFVSSVEYRRGLPLQYLRHAGIVNTAMKTNTRKELMRTVRNLFQGLWEYVDVDSAVDEMGRKLMWESLPPQHLPEERQRTCWLDGDYLKNGRVFDKAELTPDTKVRLLRYHCIRLVINANKKEATIYYNIANKGYKELEEQFLEIELDEAPIIDSLQHSYPQYKSIESIPHENLESKLKLVQVLWQYGLIVTESKVDILDSDDDDVQMTTEIVDSNDDSDSDCGENVQIPAKPQKK